ncbi:MAG: deoxyribodipyrimidine photolyase, partial [Leptospiraceae bacterium]|nr:deoxyribodipyrimidine photolyase [Leptospiraceae bacterium]
MEHRTDHRPYQYSLEQLESAATHDEIWNAAQRELVRTGKIHNYLRMLWGKKILEWSADPRTALETALHLNNKYSIDGRNPNSYSGVFWIFGRFDRPWQERPIFGKIRYMSSEQTRKKVKLREYLERFGPEEQGRLL